ncbi:MAG: FHA domain-containing protein [Planctomycetes bacterium]|nr:FHA domain-containing protein [Planctomycetota bacterium]
MSDLHNRRGSPRDYPARIFVDRMPKITVRLGDREWSAPLHPGCNVIGRSPKAAVSIQDPSVSRKHCEIRLEESGAVLHDKGSRNGTLLNGVRIVQERLSPGDEIRVGKATLRYVAQDTPARGTPLGERVSAPSENFSAWGRHPAGTYRIALLIVAGLVLASGAFYALSTLVARPEIPRESSNLVSYNASFELSAEQGVPGWQLRPGLASSLSVAPGVARHGNSSLCLQKKGAPSDAVADIGTQEIFDVQGAGTVDASVWVKTDSFPGFVALKMTWYSRIGGPVVLEDCSPPFHVPSEWSRLAHEFRAPAGAGAFQPGFSAVGRAGRVYFDDASVSRRERGKARPGVELGAYTIAAGESGAFTIYQGSRIVLANARLLLATEKEGAVPQTFASEARLSSDSEQISVAGRVLSPADLRTVDFEQEIRAGDGGSLLIGYLLRGDLLKQIDQVAFSAALPRGEAAVGTATGDVSLLPFRCEAGRFALETTEGLMRVQADGARGIWLGLLGFGRGASEFRFGLILRPVEAGEEDPRIQARRAESEGRMSDALSMCRRMARTVREPDKKQEWARDVRRLEDLELREWSAAQSALFRAHLMQRRALFERALELLDGYERRWPSGRFAASAQNERERLRAGIAEARGGKDAERARRLLHQALQFADAGTKNLARDICEAILRRYGADESAAGASELLKSLDAE